MSTELNGHSTGMGSTRLRSRRFLPVVAFTAVLVAVLSVAGLKSAVSSPPDTVEMASSPLAAAPAAPAAKAAVAPKAATKTVMIMNYTYSPASLTVNMGDTVTSNNMDTAPHTVTVASGPEKFDSGNFGKGESVSFTFTKPGTCRSTARCTPT